MVADDGRKLLVVDVAFERQAHKLDIARVRTHGVQDSGHVEGTHEGHVCLHHVHEGRLDMLDGSTEQSRKATSPSKLDKCGASQAPVVEDCPLHPLLVPVVEVVVLEALPALWMQPRGERLPLDTEPIKGHQDPLFEEAWHELQTSSSVQQQIGMGHGRQRCRGEDGRNHVRGARGQVHCGKPTPADVRACQQCRIQLKREPVIEFGCAPKESRAEAFKGTQPASVRCRLKSTPNRRVVAKAYPTPLLPGARGEVRGARSCAEG